MGFFGNRRQDKSELEYDYEPRFNERNGRSATDDVEVQAAETSARLTQAEATGKEARGKETASADKSIERTSKKGPKSADECSSIVSAGSKWQGNLNSDASVRIDGNVSGEVKAKDTIHISEGAKVDATVSANFVIIAGNFQGRVNCTERLELLPTSRVKGELTTKSLTVHEGAFIDGALHMTSPEGESAPLSGREAELTEALNGMEAASAPAGGRGKR